MSDVDPIHTAGSGLYRVERAQAPTQARARVESEPPCVCSSVVAGRCVESVCLYREKPR